MTGDELEQIYAALARQIDNVGPEQSTLYLAKLALLMAETWGDAAGARACISGAAQSLAPADAVQ